MSGDKPGRGMLVRLYAIKRELPLLRDAAEPMQGSLRISFVCIRNWSPMNSRLLP
ncbi:MAG: hypothetical protein KKA36_08040 [Gammaproteobacteria bacterium]|nr:hypothetical protein [Gammaproteobacteria bacterium]MBU2479028.1 hypothetical protein [Gammaproteobacteria bacterium]